MSSSPNHGYSPLTNQVGGHPGVMTTEDGSLIIKSALANEVAFYHSLASDPAFATLREFVPDFYGTLRLEGQVDAGAVDIDPSAIKPAKDSLVLENLSYTFLKPNVLDVKLGTALYDEDASPEKQERMDKVARETTSAETGIRFTGFQVYDLKADKPIVTPKTYGKSIKAADLSDGFARFFPLATPSSRPVASKPPPHLPGEDLSFDMNMGTGLPRDILVPLLSGIRAEVEEICKALTQVAVRMVGASLLVIYEADWERARDGLRILHEQSRENSDCSSENDKDEEEDEEDETENGAKPMGPPFVVKLIDFAHTKITLGQGPDQGVLLGLRTVLRLLKGRLEQVETASLEDP